MGPALGGGTYIGETAVSAIYAYYYLLGTVSTTAANSSHHAGNRKAID